MNDSLEKVERKKKIKISLTNNERLKKIGLIIDGKQINGYINEDGIFLNQDSKKSLNKILGHEITHALEGSKLYDALATSVKEYAETRGEYEVKYNDLK